MCNKDIIHPKERWRAVYWLRWYCAVWCGVYPSPAQLAQHRSSPGCPTYRHTQLFTQYLLKRHTDWLIIYYLIWCLPVIESAVHPHISISSSPWLSFLFHSHCHAFHLIFPLRLRSKIWANSRAAGASLSPLGARCVLRWGFLHYWRWSL